MGSAVASPPRCARCNQARLTSEVNQRPRPPCSKCGETAVNYSVELNAYVSASALITADLIPPVPARDWHSRWEEIKRRLQDIFRARTGERSREMIYHAADDVRNFYVIAYHLKDDLKEHFKSIGRDPQQVEDAVSNDPRLRLLADLANVGKHSVLNRSPRSGAVPEIVGVAGRDSGDGGWRISITVEHAGHRREGTAIAEESVAAWETALKEWGLQI